MSLCWIHELAKRLPVAHLFRLRQAWFFILGSDGVHKRVYIYTDKVSVYMNTSVSDFFSNLIGPSIDLCCIAQKPSQSEHQEQWCHPGGPKKA